MMTCVRACMGKPIHTYVYTWARELNQYIVAGNWCRSPPPYCKRNIFCSDAVNTAERGTKRGGVEKPPGSSPSPFSAEVRTGDEYWATLDKPGMLTGHVFFMYSLTSHHKPLSLYRSFFRPSFLPPLPPFHFPSSLFLFWSSIYRYFRFWFGSMRCYNIQP